jgi:hypothetical protein
VADLPTGYDPTDLNQALQHASQSDPLFTGLIYHRPDGNESYAERLASWHTGSEADANKVIDNLFARFS